MDVLHCQSQELLDAKDAALIASNAAAELAQAQASQQAHWLDRRRQQLQSCRLEIAELKDAAMARETELQAAREAQSAALSAPSMVALETAGLRGRHDALAEQLEAAQAQLRTQGDEGTRRLTEQRALLQQTDGLLKGVTEELQQERNRHRETQTAMDELETANRMLSAEGQARALELSRLSRELATMQVRESTWGEALL